MIKVLLVAGSLRIGGLETVVMNCARYMPSSDYSFDFLCWDNETGEFENEAKTFGGKVIKISSPHKGYYKFYKNIKKIMKTEGPYDIVHSHVFFLTGIVLFAARSCGVKTRIAHSHSIQRKTDGTLLRRIYCTFMRKLINKNATIKCACSTATGRYLYGTEAFDSSGVILPNVVNMASFEFSLANRDAIRREFGISKDQIVIGNIGHMLTVKNHLFLLEIFSVYAKDNNACLLIVGDGPEREKICAKMSEFSIEDKVFLAGTRMDIPQIMSAFDIFVLPSLHEGLPLTIIEAMSNGLSYVMESNIIAKELSAFDNCIKVEGYSASAWSAAISKGIEKGRFNSKTCIEQLGMFGVEHFREVLAEMYAQ